MIKTTGKRDAAKVANSEKQTKRQQAMSKRPAKTLDKLTPKEKADALDAMLEWWLLLDK